MPPIDSSRGPHMLVPKSSLPYGYAYGEPLISLKNEMSFEDARVSGYIQGTDRGMYLMARRILAFGKLKHYTKKERLRNIKEICRSEIKKYER